MSPSETYRLAVLKNPEGVLLSDVFSIVGGRKRPIVFRKVGEEIDLTTVDVKSFVSSARSGILAGMERSGSVIKVQQETSVKKTEELNAEWASQAQLGAHAKGVTSRAIVVVLEPGLQVAVGGGAMQPAGGSGNAAVAIENGVYAPKGEDVPQEIFAGVAASDGDPSAELQVVSLVDDGIGAIKATTGVSLDDVDGSKKTPSTPPTEPEAPSSWKDNKTLAEQERFIEDSQDREFLQSILDDPKESKKLKNVAKRILATLN